VASVTWAELVTRDELLSRLNTHSERTGAPPVTPRILRDWIDEGLLTPPQPIGQKRRVNPVWEYPEICLEAGMRITILSSQGIKRKSIARIYLWIDDLLSDYRSTLDSIISEHSRLQKNISRHMRKQFDHRDRLTPNDHARALAKMQQPDPRIAPWSSGVSPNDMLMAGSMATWGAGDVPVSIDSEFVAHLADKAAGLFGDSESTDQSTQSYLIRATEIDLRNATASYWQFVEFFSIAQALSGFTLDERNATFLEGVAVAGRSIISPEWVVANLAMAVAQAVREREEIAHSST
jgi:hypothetical protein